MGLTLPLASHSASIECDCITSAGTCHSAESNIVLWIEDFRKLELRYEQLICHREQIVSKEQFERITLAFSSFDDSDSPTSAVDEFDTLQKATKAHSDRSKGFSDFQRRLNISRSVVPLGLPFAAQKFVLRLSQSGKIDLEVIDREIDKTRIMMQDLEKAICACVPETARCSISKLKFLSGLLIEGVEFEQDYFAYLVFECLQFLEETLPAARAENL